MTASRGAATVQRGWWVVVALGVANAALYVGAGQGSLAVFYRALIGEFGWARGPVTLIGTLILLITAVLAYPIGVACDRIGPRAVGITAALCACLGLLVAALANRLAIFYLASAFLAVAEVGLGFVPTQVLVSAWFTARRGLALGIATTGISVGGIVGPVAVTWMIARSGWRAAFLWCALLCLAITVPAVLVLLRNRPADVGGLTESAGERAPRALDAAGLDVREAAATRTFWALTCANLGMFYAVFAIAQHFVLLITDQGGSPEYAARLLSLYYVCGLCGRFFWGAAFDRFPLKRVALVMAGSMATVVATLALASRWPLAPPLYAVVFGFGYGGFVFTIPLLMAEYFGTRHLGRILGAASAVSATLSSLSPAITGQLFDMTQSYRVPLALAALTSLASVALLATVRNERALALTAGIPRS